MPRTKTTQPAQSREKGQRSLDLPDYITRYLPQWTNPQWLMGDVWRQVVLRQPIAMICRETLIDNVTSLAWKIEPRDSTKRDELKSETQYYTKFLENNGDYDYSTIVEWIAQDYLDLPFGAAAEIGREGDRPNGKVLWIELLDGATLFPTLNRDHPVGQTMKESLGKIIYFPKHAIDRIYMTPRTNIMRKGWGMPPPEKIYLALELLNRGDIYYANLLLDTPEAGILDLIDMSKGSAENWLNSWKTLLGGIDPFKIPVLYEHEKPAVFIPFTRSPADLMFDKATMKYTSIVTAGYGMSISDIGLPTLGNGGETLAGSIRQERKTRRTGIGLMKLKIKYFFDRILPEYLQYMFIDQDDELSVALGRARLASATAYQLLLDRQVIIPNEARAQMIADGLFSISMAETIEGGDQIAQKPQPFGNTNERPDLLGRPIAPSQGGQGEVKLSSVVEDDFLRDLYTFYLGVSSSDIKRLIYSSIMPLVTELSTTYLEDRDNSAVLEVLRESSISIMTKIFPRSFVWSQPTFEYLSSLFPSIYQEYHKRKSVYDYEHLKSDIIETNFVPSDTLVQSFSSGLYTLLGVYSDVAIEYFYKSVFNGMQKFLTRPENSDKLVDNIDIETFMSDNIVEVVRGELASAFTRVCSLFNDDYSKLIQINLEELNDASKD